METTESTATLLEKPLEKKKRTSPWIKAYDEIRLPREQELRAIRATVKDRGHITHQLFMKRFRLRAELGQLYALRHLARTNTRENPRVR